MPIELRYIEESEFLVGTLSSPLKPEEFREALETIVASDQYSVDIRTLWDGSDLDFHTINRGLLERMVEVRNDFPQRGEARLAFVVDNDLGFGMARMYEILSEELPQESRVFRSFKEGQDWLIKG